MSTSQRGRPRVLGLRVLWLAAIAVVMLEAGWMVLHSDEQPAAPKPSPWLRTAILSDAMVQPTESAAAPARLSASAAGEDVAMVELCGLGRVSRAQMEEAGAADRILRVPIRQALIDTLAALAASPDDGRRAAARLLAGAQDELLNPPESSDGESPQPTIEACTKPCLTPVLPPARSAAFDGAIDALARIAATTRDPWVYQLAVQRCQSGVQRVAGACQLVGASRWAQIEPDNAMAWLHVANEARDRGDAPAVEEALHRAAHAPRNEARFGRLAGVVGGAVPEAVAPFVAQSVDVLAIGIDAAAVVPGYQMVTRHCSAEALRDPNRRETCDALARMLVERSTTLLDLGLGRSIGKRLGWDTARLASIEADVKRMQAASTHLVSPPDATGCKAVESLRGYARALSERGEVAALKGLADLVGSPQSEAAASGRAEPLAPR